MALFNDHEVQKPLQLRHSLGSGNLVLRYLFIESWIHHQRVALRRHPKGLHQEARLHGNDIFLLFQQPPFFY